MDHTCSLNSEEMERYDRQIMIRDFGVEGQKKLKRACVLIVGAGGLGCPITTYLTAAGVGKLLIVDFDRVALSNLNRQVLHWQENLDDYKARSAAEKLKRLNPHVSIKPLTEKLDKENIKQYLSGVDIIIDALDNFETRLILNEAAVAGKIPFIYGGINGFVGMTTTIIPYESPCLACIFPNSPPAEEKFPVLGTTPAVIGSIESTEAIKHIVGLGENLVGRLLIYNGEDMRFNEVSIERNPDCPVCGTSGETT